jgi:hypothetical protein
MCFLTSLRPWIKARLSLAISRGVLQAFTCPRPNQAEDREVVLVPNALIAIILCAN